MNKDAKAVKHLLAERPDLVGYTDRQAESMLHLAAIFNLTDIALALVNAGADADVKNSHNESPLDIAQPALRAKLAEALRLRQA
jgi:ankyrin repeat protein